MECDRALTCVCIPSIMYLSNTISCTEYSQFFVFAYSSDGTLTPKDPMSSSTPQSVRDACDILANFYTPNLVDQLLSLCLQHLLLLDAENLWEWTSSPEEYLHNLEKRSQDYSIQTAAESLFTSLTEKLPQTVLAKIVECLEDGDTQINASVETTNTEAVLPVEALYYGMGLASFVLIEEIDFNAYFGSIFHPMIKQLMSTENESSNQQDEDLQVMLVRRMVWMFACFSSMMDNETRFICYEWFSFLLSSSLPFSDSCVQITTLTTLNQLAAIDRRVIMIGDEESPLFSHLEGLFAGIYQVIGEFEETTSKAEALQSINILVSSISQSFPPDLGNAILSPLSDFWGEWGEDENILRNKILSTTTTVVKILKGDSSELYSMIIPFIEVSISSDDDQVDSNNLNPDSYDEENLYLIESGLILWQTLIFNSTSYTEDLHTLFQLSFPHLIIKADLDNLQFLFLLLEGYVVLGKETFLNEFSELLLRTIAKYLVNVREKAVDWVAHCLEITLCVGKQSILPLLKDFEVLENLFFGIWMNEDRAAEDRMKVLYLSCLARMISLVFNFFIDLRRCFDSIFCLFVC